MEGKIVLSHSEIDSICKRLGKEITESIKDDKKIPVIVGVLKGAINFMMDLIKYIEVPVFTDYIQIRSYAGTSSTGQVQLLKDLSFDCSDRTVIIVEDIVDTGCSMEFLLKHVNAHNPKRTLITCLFDKVEARKRPIKVDFVGKVLKGTDFLIGYGLDYDEIHRNLPYVYAATKSDVEALKEIIEKDNK